MNSTTASSLSLVPALLLGLALTPLAQAQMLREGQQVSASYSRSSDSDVKGKGVALGELGAQYSSFEYTYAAKLDEQLLAGLGVGYSTTQLDVPLSLPVPDKLQELSLRLSGQYRLENRQWSLFGAASPGFREAGSGLESKAFSVPVLAGASFAQKPGLIWSFGAAYNAFSQYKVLPFVGVYWRFAPQWTFTVGYPQLGLSYELNKALTLRTGLSAKGGSYWVKQTVSSLSSIPPYRDTYLDYREIRAGVGADWTLSPGLKLALDLGAVTDRRFQYHELHHNYNGDPAAYVSVQLSYGF